jgi:anti-sigma-K factor RskA
VSSTPGADHTPEHLELAGLYALRVLDDDERAEFERHLAGCTICQAAVAADRETVSALSLGAPEMEPSPGFRERLLRAAAAELEGDAVSAEPALAQPAPPPAPIPFWRRRLVPQLLAAALAVVVGGAALLGIQGYRNQVVSTVPLQGSGPGSAVVLVRRSGAADLQLSGLDPLPPGKVYEAWVIPEGGQPIASGTSSTPDAILPLPDNYRGSVVALTQENSPGASAPSQPPFLAAPVNV